MHDTRNLIQPNELDLPVGARALQAEDGVGSLALLRITKYLRTRANAYHAFADCAVAHMQCNPSMRWQGGNQCNQALDIYLVRTNLRSFLAHTTHPLR